MKNTKAMIQTALFAAVLAVCSVICIPLPTGMPLTLQTFGTALAGFVLGWKHGAAAVGVYLAVGAAGLPVFSGFTGGFARLFGPTGGYLWGFLALAALCGTVPLKKKRHCAVFSLLGLLLCHAAGTMQFSLAAEIPFLTAFLTASVPYLAKDILSLMGAYITAAALRNAMGVR